MDWMGASVGCVGTLVHDDSVRNVALICPSVRTGAPSPQGKALVTQYNFAG